MLVGFKETQWGNSVFASKTFSVFEYFAVAAVIYMSLSNSTRGLSLVKRCVPISNINEALYYCKNHKLLTVLIQMNLWFLGEAALKRSGFPLHCRLP